MAAAQIRTDADPVANLAIATDAVRRAAAAGAELVAPPEATLAAFGSDLRAVAEPLDGPFATGPDVEVSYRKIHLYDAFGSRESDLVAPGKELVTFEVRWGDGGLATCYDLRFSSRHSGVQEPTWS